MRTILTLMLCLICGTAAAADLPAGFAEAQVANGLDPAGMAFAPDGRLFVLEKAGRVRIVKNGAMLPASFIDIRSSTDNFGERGLLGIAFHPNFASNGWVYLHHTQNTSPSHNRVIRVTASGDTAAGGQTTIIDLPGLSSQWHNGGPLLFGADGKLYIAVGENTDTARSQNVNSRQGKLLRLNDDGSVPADNPIAGNPYFCMGLRNPFGLAIHRTSGVMFINDVGAGSWEEINEVGSGRNFGWPIIEGRRGGESPPANYRDPVHAYDHGAGYCITGGDFYTPSAPGPDAFPSAWTGRYLFADYGGSIRWIDPANPGTRNGFIANAARPIAVAVAPDGAVWYLARAGIGGGSDQDSTSSSNGSLWRVRSTVTPAPVATNLAFLQQPTSTAAGSIIVPAVRVAVRDASGNTVTASNATVNLAMNIGTLGGTTSVAAVNGVATFANLSVPTPSTGLVLTASSSGLTSAASAAFDAFAAAAAPQVTPGGSFSGPVWVQMTSATAGAALHYTLDGSTPTTASAVYAAAFRVSATTTVKAIAVKSGLAASAVATVTVTITGSTPYGIAYRELVSGLAITADPATAPAVLSATGAFTDLAALAPRAGIIPYGVNSPLWSDNADKQRWIALPGGAKIGFTATGEWNFPAGTILIKHFHIGGKRLETRFFVVNPPGGSTYGITYRWRADNSDADLVPSEGADEVLANGQTWRYPSQSQCMQCHTPNAGSVLGVSTRQLNGAYGYPSGVVDNQLRTWNYLQMFTSDIGESTIPAQRKLSDVSSSASLEERSRSYLDANCAFCHRPNGASGGFDARYDTPLASQGLINGSLQRGDLGIPGAKVIVPGDRLMSVLLVRMSSEAVSQRMPPVGRSIVHGAAVDVIGQWIDGMPPMGSGTITRQYWTGVSGPPLGNVPFSTAPSGTEELTLFEGPTNWGENYGTRMLGYVVAPETGTYTFWLATDDDGELWLSTDANPGNKRRIASIVGWAGAREWNKFASQKSVAITLTAGQSYYIEATQVEGAGGGDSIAVGWSKPGQSTASPSEVIPGSALKPWVAGTTVAPVITTQPQNRSIMVGQSATFSVVASGTPSPTYQWQRGGVAIAGATSASYTLSAAALSDSGAQFTCVVSNSAGALTSAAATLTVTEAPSGTGTITRQYWTGVSGPPLSNVPWASAPSGTDALTSFEGPTNWRDNYGTRILGYVVASETGDHTFWLATDDDGELWLSTDANPANKRRIASITGWSDARQWNKFASQKSATIALTAGQSYYIEVLQVEGAGGDNIAVGWSKPGQSTASPSEVIPGSALRPWVSGTAVAPVITTQPQDRSVVVGQSATFSAVASGTPSPTYQWQRGGVAISGASSASYTVNAVALSDSGAQFTCVVSNSAGSLTSATATLTVTEAPSGTGTITRQYWTGVSGPPLSNVPFASTPSGTNELTSFEGPSLWRDNYGSRILGYVVAPVTGDYTFWLATDDHGELWLSTDASPANKRRIASISGWAAVRQWNKFPSQKSVAVALAAGQTYYIEALQVEGGGGDNIAVGWSRPGQSTASPSEVIPGSVLKPWVSGTSVAPVITTQPQAQAVVVGQNATFSVVASGTPTPSYQWLRGGAAIAGATTASHTLVGALAADNGAQFACVVSNSAGTVTSNAVTLTVNPAPPAGAWSSRDIGGVGIAGSWSLAGTTHTVRGSGTDIWDATDQFHFVSQPLTGDATIVARVVSLGNTDPWAKAGVMIRETVAGGSRHVYCGVTPGNGVFVEQREATNGATGHSWGPRTTAPCWVRLERQGATIRGYESADGQTWTLISTVSISLTNPVQIGLAVTSHNNGAITTAVFDSVALTPAGGG